MSPTPLTVAIIHGGLMLLSFLLLYFVVPKFFDMFLSLGGCLPSSTYRAMAVSQFLRYNLFLVIPGIGLLLWLDVKMYARLYRQRGRRAGLLWFWGWAVILALAMPAIGLAIFTPIFMPGGGLSH